VPPGERTLFASLRVTHEGRNYKVIGQALKCVSDREIEKCIIEVLMSVCVQSVCYADIHLIIYIREWQTSFGNRI